MKFNLIPLLFLSAIFLVVLSSFRFDTKEISKYKPSPLAKLMIQMNLDMRNTKEKLLAGKKLPDYNKKWAKMQTATPTDAGVKGEKYDAFAESFLYQYNSFLEADEENKKSTYNNLVSNCITCHEHFCPGPIQLIKKLHIAN